MFADDAMGAENVIGIHYSQVLTNETNPSIDHAQS